MISFFTNQLVKVNDVVCGDYYSYFLADISLKSAVYSCGRGLEGQLGFGKVDCKSYPK